jgi:ribosomal-protein-alanine N-acetyltransferase
MPTVETARLLMRMFAPDDLDALAVLFGDPDVMRYVGAGVPVGRADAEIALKSILQHWERNGFGRWAIVDRQTGEFIGFGGLRSLFGTPEVVYHLGKPHWGKGYATEMARASLRFGFEKRGFKRIVALAKPENVASIHVMRKLGMHFEKNATYYDLEVVQYQIECHELITNGWRFLVHEP